MLIESSKIVIELFLQTIHQPRATVAAASRKKPSRVSPKITKNKYLLRGPLQKKIFALDKNAL